MNATVDYLAISLGECIAQKQELRELNAELLTQLKKFVSGRDKEALLIIAKAEKLK